MHLEKVLGQSFKGRKKSTRNKYNIFLLEEGKLDTMIERCFLKQIYTEFNQNCKEIFFYFRNNEDFSNFRSEENIQFYKLLINLIKNIEI